MERSGRFERYVAIGDSQTEGLHDYHAGGELRGWADRFAESLAKANASMLYANLAVRGKRTAQVREGQLGAALELSPDLVTVVSGVNDVLLPSADIRGTAGELQTMYRELGKAGSVVMGCTFPLPKARLTRWVAPRLRTLNEAIRAAAASEGALLVELEDLPDAADLRLWSADRIHLNGAGHRRLAAAFAGCLDGAPREEWAEPLPEAKAPSRMRRVAGEAAWVARFVVPKVIRTARGRSLGDGRGPKRPELSRPGVGGC